MSFINKLLLGDNLEILKGLPDESVDLVYLDPPFFSNRNYEVIWGDSGEVRSFQDRWSGGVDHYIAWLKERVAEMHRILKPTGSIFLHCDWHANAYIRVEILDKLFGYGNFRNEIIWKRTNAHNEEGQLGKIYDTIFYYSKTSRPNFNTIKSPYDVGYIDSFFKHEDNRGQYRLQVLTGAGTRNGDSDSEWNGYIPSKSGRHWAMPKKLFAKVAEGIDTTGWSIIQKLDLLFEHGHIVFTKNGTPNYKQYIDDHGGVQVNDLWTDIENVSLKAERIGYPTQKPIALLERIIKIASNEGDIVLDPFVGGGTTVAAADKLQRRWIGIDQSVQAVKVTELRLNQQQALFSQPFTVQLHKYDYDRLRNMDAFEFEQFIVTQFGGQVNKKQRGDLGMDGKAADGRPIQVKRSDDIGRNVVDNFKAACERYDKKAYEAAKAERRPIGTIIAFSFGKGAIQEVARLKNQEDVFIDLKRVDEIIPIAQKPKLTVSLQDAGSDKKGLREIAFAALGESPAGIEFYAWDFEHDPAKGFKPTVLIDKEGMQTFRFKPGMHTIAAKVIDNDGMEAIETLRLKVNGEVTRVGG